MKWEQKDSGLRGEHSQDAHKEAWESLLKPTCKCCAEHVLQR